MHLVIVTCAVETTTSSSCFSVPDRILQIKNTIYTIQHRIPNPYIVILETGSATEEQKKELQAFVHEIHSNVLTTVNKNTGEATMMYNYLQSDAFKKIFDTIETINKVSGRYFLNDKFNFNRYPLDTLIIKHRRGDIGEHLYETRYYRFPISHFKYFFEKLHYIITSENNYLAAGDVEHLFYDHVFFPMDKTQYILGFTDTDKIGVAGWVSGDGTYIED